jgi:hypothetical protein
MADVGEVRGLRGDYYQRFSDGAIAADRGRGAVRVGNAIGAKYDTVSHLGTKSQIPHGAEFESEEYFMRKGYEAFFNGTGKGYESLMSVAAASANFTAGIGRLSGGELKGFRARLAALEADGGGGYGDRIKAVEREMKNRAKYPKRGKGQKGEHMKFSEYQRRIRPELAERIGGYQLEEAAGRYPDTIGTTQFARGEYDGEKEIWALNEQTALWEYNTIRLGFRLLELRERVTHETYLEVLERQGIPEEYADAVIQACMEDKQNG